MPDRQRLIRRIRNQLIQLAATVLVLTIVPIAALRYVDPPTTLFMIADRWEAALGDEAGYHFEYQWQDLDNIDPDIQLAVIAAEDQRFADHAGFDLVEISHAVSARLDGTSSRGASTITQQTAKNLFLWSGQSWVRKGLEAWLTLWIEWLWPKKRILEVYLNVAEFGPGVFGVAAASSRFFKGRADRLTAEQSALLAAVLPNPRLYRADAPGPRVLKRQRWILRQIKGIGGMAYLSRLD
jgi:monofunctional biosynthetic peptidoglycan transglycosylase